MDALVALPPSFFPCLGTSFVFHSTLSVTSYGLGRALNRAESKDWFWASAMVSNAWFQSVGYRVWRDGATFGEAFGLLTWKEKLLLAGVTAWGARLTYRIVSRSIKRGTDDPRYESVKLKSNFWNAAIFTSYIPEALFQTLITIPFTAPFRIDHSGGIAGGDWGLWNTFAVGLWGVGMALEVGADMALASWKNKPKGEHFLKSGVFSIVRHPNYLGDFLTHLSFPILLIGSPTFHWIYFAGPLANLAYLRLFGGDSEDPDNRERWEKAGERNKSYEWRDWSDKEPSFFPSWSAILKPATWSVVAIGGLAAAAEIVARSYVQPRVL